MQRNLISLTYSLQRTIVRNYARKSAPKRNPGIEKRLKILDDEDALNTEDLDLENLETDFADVGKMHGVHEKELDFYREKEKFWIVKRKYFKEAKINFLTWSDKEQIQHLHQSNPEEWTLEKLAEGFPAVPETIAKIIKSKWHKKNETKIIYHDESVEQNWKLLREGKLSDQLSPDLIQHLMKFSARKLQKHEKRGEIMLQDDSKRSKIGEFESIIDSYEALKNRTKPVERKSIENSTQHVNLLIDKPAVKDRKVVTLSQLKEKMSEHKEFEKILDKNVTQNQENLKRYDIHNIIKNKHDLRTELLYKEPEKPKEVVQYPEKILIPKDKYKKGCTYKLNDCYYDDDGEFLYRVPGMY